ncbi:MAG: hypothetical protein WC455_12645 [Dehalococcoidia bacterium]|jgi:hypothetical protein
MARCDCEIPEQEIVLLREERRPGASSVEIARFPGEIIPDLYARTGQGHDMRCQGWRYVEGPYWRASLATKEYFYCLVDPRLRAEQQHAAYLKWLRELEQLPYLWQD